MSVEIKLYMEFTCDVCGSTVSRNVDTLGDPQVLEDEQLDEIDPNELAPGFCVVRLTDETGCHRFTVCGACVRTSSLEALQDLVAVVRPSIDVDPTQASSAPDPMTLAPRGRVDIESFGQDEEN